MYRLRIPKQKKHYLRRSDTQPLQFRGGHHAYPATWPGSQQTANHLAVLAPEPPFERPLQLVPLGHTSYLVDNGTCLSGIRTDADTLASFVRRLRRHLYCEIR